MVKFFAHALPGAPEESWQPLEDHLRNVAARAAEFAGAFGAEDWGRLAGMWHDLGKYSDAFQQYLRSAATDAHVGEATGRIDHSTAGAQHAVNALVHLGHLLAYPIAGHHSGLLDGRSERACLEARLKKPLEAWDAAPSSITDAPSMTPPVLATADPFAVAFFVRMVFSCLVDADFLDTEAFLAPERASSRPNWAPELLPRLEKKLDEHIAGFGPPDNEVGRQRGSVREACLDAADQEPGLFSLTVPTGGGKTLASLAFALRHAVRHDLRRVIYVAPFTSIIEQNADVFRRVFVGIDPDPVLEHHCNVDSGKETLTSRLATETWDAPVVVTTSVQFYESLFARRTSRCRKLHNLARSVIVLDEVQAIPVDRLAPCLRVIRELTSSYGATAVLCTATQPAVHKREEFTIGLDNVREIVPDPRRLYAALKRTDVVDIGEQADAALLERLLAQRQVLCIVNTRAHARELFEMLGEAEGHYHLSAAMCPQHRTEVLKRIVSGLDGGDLCRVVSTQVVEAGVDIDFPVVFRSMAGLDSIAQAAGRCNREGRLEGRGRTFVFRSGRVASERFLVDTCNVAAQVLPIHPDALALDAIDHYFRLYYWDQSSRWDRDRILDEFHFLGEPDFPCSFGFAAAARRFRLIEDSGKPVIVPIGEGRELCERLRRQAPLPSGRLLRSLQRYTVQIPRSQWQSHAGRTFELLNDRYPILISPEIHYSQAVGLRLDDDATLFLSC